MHRIKRQAKRHAWYSDEEEGPNLNPFGKHGISHVSSRKSVDVPDLEAGNSRPSYPGRAPSESAYRSEDETRRQSTFQTPGRTFSEKQRLPPLSSGSTEPRRSLNLPQNNEKNGINYADQDGMQRGADPHSFNTESTATSGTLATRGEDRDDTQSLSHVATAQATDPGPRRRKFGGLIGAFKRTEEKAERQDSDELGQVDSRGKKKRPEPVFTWQSQIRHTIFNSPINILLIASPVGIALSQVSGGVSSSTYPQTLGSACFAINFLAIVPLAALLSFATEEVALRTGETIGGLLNATLGNATELIVSIIALFQGQILITQTSLIGSMLSNLLLVLGMCFFFGGLTRVKQNFNVTVAQTASSLLALALGGLIIPTVFDINTNNTGQEITNITQISRGVSILLLVVYACYLFFQLKTHVDIYNAPSEKQPKRNIAKGQANKGIAQMGGIAGFMAPVAQGEYMPEDGDDEEIPKLSLTVAIITLLCATALIAANSEFMVDAIPLLTAHGGISESFLGLILIPIVGNAAEHATAVTVACKDKMDLAIGVAVGSSMQIALLVLPLVVVIGWIAGIDDMTLDFDIFQVTMLFVAILLVNYLISDGESHWLEGFILMILYMAIALAAWFYPAQCQTDLCPAVTQNTSITARWVNGAGTT